MKTIVLLLSLAFFPGALQAQYERNKTWAISYTHFADAIQLGIFGLQLGGEYFFTERISLLTDLTVGMAGKSKKKGIQDINFYRFKPELRYNFGDHSKSHYYSGLRISYTFRDFQLTKQGYYFDEDLPAGKAYRFDTAQVSSPLLTASVQFGMVFVEKKRLTFDVFIGFGKRFANTNYSGTANLTVEDYEEPRAPDGFLTPTPSYKFAGRTSYFHMNVGFRILYKFSKQQSADK